MTLLFSAAGVFLHGCGTGLRGEDDVRRLSCAPGTASPMHAPTSPSAQSSDRVHLYFLRGLDNTYSLGLDQLAEKMPEFGLHATVVAWPTWKTTAQQIELEYPDWPDNSQLILVGHSFGADDSVRIAQYLYERDIPVQLVILLDAAAEGPIPANVDRCVNYYVPTIIGDLAGWFYPGHVVSPADDNTHTEIVNIPFMTNTIISGTGCTNHFNVDVNIMAHNLIIEEIMHVTNASPE